MAEGLEQFLKLRFFFQFWNVFGRLDGFGTFWIRIRAWKRPEGPGPVGARYREARLSVRSIVFDVFDRFYRFDIKVSRFLKRHVCPIGQIKPIVPGVFRIRVRFEKISG